MLYEFKTVLEEKVITVEDILNQARIDADYGICFEGAYSDGGSVEYLYDIYYVYEIRELHKLKSILKFALLCRI